MPRKREKHIKLDDELLAWYEANYPEQSINWIIHELLTEFKDVANSNTVKQHVEITAQNILDRGSMYE